MLKFQTEAVKRHWVVVSVLHFTAVEKPNTVEATPQLQVIKDSGTYVRDFLLTVYSVSPNNHIIYVL